MSKSLGDRIKSYEQRYTGDRFLPGVPVVARIDGKRFSKFTRKMEKPFDPGFTELMVKVTAELVKQTSAKVGYTQSDEITLIFHHDHPKSEIFLNGRVQKMTSILASMATGIFNYNRDMIRGEGGGPAFFDCRVFQVPSKVEAVNSLIWREFNAVRNSISMLAQHHFSHKRLHGKNTSQMQDMLMLEKSVNWNALPVAHRRGTYVQRRVFIDRLTSEELERINTVSKQSLSVDHKVTRSRVVPLKMPPITRVVNRVDVVFDAVDVELADTPSQDDHDGHA